MKLQLVTLFYSVVIFFISTNSVAETNSQAQMCIDYYAAMSPKFNCNKALRVFRGIQKPCMSVLYRTFGKSKKCLRRFKSLKGEKTLKIFATNQSCERLKRCESFDRSHTIPRIKKNTKDVINLSHELANEHMNIILAPGLEHKWSRGKVREIFEYTQEVWNGQIINNPVGSDASRAFGYHMPYVELHSHKSRFRGATCIYSNDGADVNLSKRRRNKNGISISTLLARIERLRKRCDYISIWWNTQGATKLFTPPSKRIFQIYSSDVHIVNNLLKQLE